MSKESKCQSIAFTLAANEAKPDGDGCGVRPSEVVASARAVIVPAPAKALNRFHWLKITSWTVMFDAVDTIELSKTEGKVTANTWGHGFLSK